MKQTEFYDMVKTFVDTSRAFPLYKCQACYTLGYVTNNDGNIIDCAFLKSYSTYCCLINLETRTAYVFDYYSATTVQHVWKFIRKFNCKSVYFLYKRSDNRGYCKLPYSEPKTYAQIIDNIEF